MDPSSWTAILSPAVLAIATVNGSSDRGYRQNGLGLGNYDVNSIKWRCLTSRLLYLRMVRFRGSAGSLTRSTTVFYQLSRRKGEL